MFGRKMSLLWRRRRLLALGGVGAALAANGLAGTARTAHAAQIVGTNNYSGSLDSTADGVQGYAVGANNAGTFGRNNDLNGVGVFGAAPSGTGVFGESATGFGVGGKSDSKYGVFGQATNGVGGAFEGGLAAIRLVPAASGTGAPTTGAHQVGELYADSAGTLFYCTVAGTPGTWLPVVLGSSSLTTVEASLASTVTMNPAGTWYDGPLVSLSPGTWMLFASVTVRSDAGNAIVGKLWDGTNVESSVEHDTTTAATVFITLCGRVTVASTTTWKVSVICGATGYIRASTTSYATSEASRLVGIKVG